MAGKSKQTNGVIGSNNPHISKKWFVFGAIILLVLICAGAWLIYDNNSRKSAEIKSKEVIAAENKRDNEANSHIFNNDPEAAVKVYQKNIDSYSDNNQKASAYIDMAAMLYDYDSAKYKERVLQYAYKAEALASSAATATFIYDMETNYKNKSAADKYYAIMVDRSKDNESEPRS